MGLKHKDTDADIDFTEMRCPQLLVEIKLLTRKMRSGERLRVAVCDVRIVPDLTKLSEKMGFDFELLELESRETLITLKCK